MNDKPPYRDIEPRSLEYLELIKMVLKTGDKETLSALRGGAGKPIRLVSDWFNYAMRNSTRKTDADEVVIYTPETQSDRLKAFATLEERRRNNLLNSDSE